MKIFMVTIFSVFVISQCLSLAVTSSLIFAAEAGAYPTGALTRLLCKGKLLALTAKLVAVTNTLAYKSEPILGFVALSTEVFQHCCSIILP